jgi:hypothetical protein
MFSSGLIMQWTQGSIVNSPGHDTFLGQVQNISWPIPFPTAVLQVIVGTNFTNSNLNDSNLAWQHLYTNLTTTGTTIVLQLFASGAASTGSTYASIIAFGY